MNEDYLERAAFSLYMATKPEGGMPWDFLTHDQQQRYRNLAKLAARMTDVTALRAAFERGAGGLAVHSGVCLRDCAGPRRRALRFQAMDCVRAFEDSLMSGDERSDALTLKLQDEERQEDLNNCHARALEEDAAEMARQRARRDIERYSPIDRRRSDGAVDGDGRN